MMRLALALATSLLFAVPGLASGEQKVPLAKEPHINEQLIAAAAGDLLRQNCPKVSARMFVIWDKMWQLRTYAVGLGYTPAEVKAFLKDKDEKARVKAAGAAYVQAAGAKPGNVDSYCTVARNEVAKGTLVGQIIWVAR